MKTDKPTEPKVGTRQRLIAAISDLFQRKGLRGARCPGTSPNAQGRAIPPFLRRRDRTSHHAHPGGAGLDRSNIRILFAFRVSSC